MKRLAAGDLPSATWRGARTAKVKVISVEAIEKAARRDRGRKKADGFQNRSMENRVEQKSLCVRGK